MQPGHRENPASSERRLTIRPFLELTDTGRCSAPWLKDRAAHHELPHDDAKGVDVAQRGHAVCLPHFRCTIERRARPHVTQLTLASAASQADAEVVDFWYDAAGAERALD